MIKLIELEKRFGCMDDGNILLSNVTEIHKTPSKHTITYQQFDAAKYLDLLYLQNVSANLKKTKHLGF